jgi:hypothetical protein
MHEATVLEIAPAIMNSKKSLDDLLLTSLVEDLRAVNFALMASYITK